MRLMLPIMALLAATPSHSEELFPNERPGFYLGGGPSFTNVLATDDNTTASSERGDSDYGFAINAGYRFNPWLAIDVGYLDGGTPEFNDSDFGSRVDTEVDLTAFQVAGVATLPFFGIWELYLKLGVSAWDADSDQVLTPVGGPSVFRREDRNGPGFLIGLGLGVTLAENWHARVEYQTFGIDDELLALDAISTAEDDASFESVNLQLHYRFGGRKKKPEPLPPPEPRRTRD